MNRHKSKNFLSQISEELKPLNSAEDLVLLGISGSTKTLANLRSLGRSPAYVKIRGTGIRYTREAILSWLEHESIIQENA